MADDVAVREVRHDEVIALPQCIPERFRHFRQAQFRHGLEGHALRRRDADIILSCVGRIVAAVEEEGDVGVFFTLSQMQLGLPGFGKDLREAHLHLGRGEGDRQVGVFFIVHRQDHEIQRFNLFPRKSRKCRIRERVGQFDLALSSAAAENDAVAGLHGPDGRAAFPKVQRFQMVIRLPALIDFLHRFRQGFAAGFQIFAHGLSVSPFAAFRKVFSFTGEQVQQFVKMMDEAVGLVLFIEGHGEAARIVRCHRARKTGLFRT